MENALENNHENALYHQKGKELEPIFPTNQIYQQKLISFFHRQCSRVSLTYRVGSDKLNTKYSDTHHQENKIRIRHLTRAT